MIASDVPTNSHVFALLFISDFFPPETCLFFVTFSSTEQLSELMLVSLCVCDLVCLHCIAAVSEF